jgi:hypothetical protein
MRLIRRRRPRLAVAACALAVVVGAGGVAVAKSHVIPPPFEPKSKAAARYLALQRVALELINQANRHVFAAIPSCKPSFPRPSGAVTHDTPSQPVLDAIAELRRPASPADQLPPSRHPFRFGFGETYVDYVRTATAANGQRFYIVVQRAVPPSYRPAARCLDAEHAQLVTLLRGKSHRLRSVALREFAKMRHVQEQTPEQPQTPQDGLSLFTAGPQGIGVGGGGGDIAMFLDRGTFGSSGNDSSSTLNGLVPDGVATVTLEYPKVVSRGPYYKPTVFPSAYRRTVRVQENVLSVHVPRGAGDAFPRRMVWRSADGRVLHVFTDRRG